MTTALSERRRFDSFLAWYFVTVWGSGYLASKIGLQYAAPFTFLTLRFAFGIACMLPIVPTALSLAGIAVTCAGVALVTWTRGRPASQ